LNLIFSSCNFYNPKFGSVEVAQASCLCSSASKECGTGVSPVSSGKVFINSTQYFDNVPETAWNFYIGGYQPPPEMAERPQIPHPLLR
jgi:hypothetical protein